MAERGRTWIILIGGVFLCAGLGLVSVHVPFGRDQGVSAYVAEVMAQGGVVYRDVYHFNFPGIFFAYLLARFIPLPFPESVNLFHVTLVLLTYLAVYAAARQLLKKEVAALAGFFYGAFSVVMYTDYWDIAQKESLACLPLALCLLASFKALPAANQTNGGLLKEPKQNRSKIGWAALAGLFAGFAAQFKPTLAIVLIACLYPAFAGLKWRKPGFKSLGAAAAGFVISFVPLLLYLLSTDSLGAMAESVFRFGGFYGGQSYQGLSHVLKKSSGNLVSWLYEWRFLVVLSVAALVSYRKSGDLRIRLLLVFGLLLLFQVIVQMKFFTYHWIPLLLPASVMAAAGAAYIARAAKTKTAPGGISGPREKSYRAVIVLVLFALFLGNLVPSGKRYKRELLYDLGMIAERDFLSAYGSWGGGDISPLASQAVADYIKENASPGEPVLVFGLEPGLYIAAERFAPTRFAYDQPLVTRPRGNDAFRAYRSRLRSEFLSDISENPPVYIIVIENDATSIEPQESYEQMKEFASFYELVKRDYFLENKIEDYFIYRRLRGGD
ncbi:MAG: hypothetical protein R6V10_04020 [bacterium]